MNELFILELDKELHERYGTHNQTRHYCGKNKNETHVFYIFNNLKRKIQVGYTAELLERIKEINPSAQKMQTAFDIYSNDKIKRVTEL